MSHKHTLRWPPSHPIPTLLFGRVLENEADNKVSPSALLFIGNHAPVQIERNLQRYRDLWLCGSRGLVDLLPVPTFFASSAEPLLFATPLPTWERQARPMPTIALLYRVVAAWNGCQWDRTHTPTMG